MSQEKEYFGAFPKWLRLTVLPWYIWAALVVTAIWATSAYAEPRFQVVANGARVVLFDDKCAVSAVTNLPYKATWEEKGKVYQGCWGARPEAGIVMFYFDDRSVGIIPIQELTAIRGV
jgi:hypothetical protein